MILFRSLKPLKPIITKEFRQIRRDPTSLGMLLGLPSILIVLVGYALDLDVKHVPLIAFDQDKTPESRLFLEKFKHTQYFQHKFDVYSYREIDELLMDGKAMAAIVVPIGFAKELAAGRSVRMQILVDGSNSNSALQAVGYASRIAADQSASLLKLAVQRMGGRQYVPIDFNPRIWYNPDLISSKFLIPGLIGFILVLTAVVSTSLTVVREKERGTMEQLMVSPLRPVHIILGKTIPYVLISLLAATAILILGYLLFDIEVKGSLLTLYAGIFTIILGH